MGGPLQTGQVSSKSVRWLGPPLPGPFVDALLNINTSAITNSIVNGINTNTIAVVPTDNLTRSFPFTFEPRRPLYCNLSSFNIAEMRIYVTDSLGRPVNVNGIDWFMTLILHSM